MSSCSAYTLWERPQPAHPPHISLGRPASSFLARACAWSRARRRLRTPATSPARTSPAVFRLDGQLAVCSGADGADTPRTATCVDFIALIAQDAARKQESISRRALSSTIQHALEASSHCLRTAPLRPPGPDRAVACLYRIDQVPARTRPVGGIYWRGESRPPVVARPGCRTYCNTGA